MEIIGNRRKNNIFFFYFSKMVLNPWEVHSIDDFNYFCCPECVFRSKEDISFQAHALQNHELSKTFFNNVEQGNL